MTDPEPLDRLNLLESLAESRMGLLSLERKAREGGDKAAADELAARGWELKDRIDGLRRIAHDEWDAAARGLGERFRQAQAVPPRVRSVAQLPIFERRVGLERPGEIKALA